MRQSTLGQLISTALSDADSHLKLASARDARVPDAEDYLTAELQYKGASAAAGTILGNLAGGHIESGGYPVSGSGSVLGGMIGGAVEGKRHGEALEGAARGAAGALVGGIGGAVLGGILGSVGGVPGALVGATVGRIVGGPMGAHSMTKKYREGDKEKKSEAEIYDAASYGMKLAQALELGAHHVAKLAEGASPRTAPGPAILESGMIGARTITPKATSNVSERITGPSLSNSDLPTSKNDHTGKLDGVQPENNTGKKASFTQDKVASARLLRAKQAQAETLMRMGQTKAAQKILYDITKEAQDPSSPQPEGIPGHSDSFRMATDNFGESSQIPDNAGIISMTRAQAKNRSVETATQYFSETPKTDPAVAAHTLRTDGQKVSSLIVEAVHGRPFGGLEKVALKPTTITSAGQKIGLRGTAGRSGAAAARASLQGQRAATPRESAGSGPRVVDSFNARRNAATNNTAFQAAIEAGQKARTALPTERARGGADLRDAPERRAMSPGARNRLRVAEIKGQTKVPVTSPSPGMARLEAATRGPRRSLPEAFPARDNKPSQGFSRVDAIARGAAKIPARPAPVPRSGYSPTDSRLPPNFGGMNRGEALSKPQPQPSKLAEADHGRHFGGLEKVAVTPGWIAKKMGLTPSGTMAARMGIEHAMGPMGKLIGRPNVTPKMRRDMTARTMINDIRDIRGIGFNGKSGKPITSSTSNAKFPAYRRFMED